MPRASPAPRGRLRRRYLRSRSTSSVPSPHAASSPCRPSRTVSPSRRQLEQLTAYTLGGKRRLFRQPFIDKGFGDARLSREGHGLDLRARAGVPQGVGSGPAGRQAYRPALLFPPETSRLSPPYSFDG